MIQPVFSVANTLKFPLLILLLNYSILPQVKWQCHKRVHINVLKALHNSSGSVGAAYMQRLIALQDKHLAP